MFSDYDDDDGGYESDRKRIKFEDKSEEIRDLKKQLKDKSEEIRDLKKELKSIESLKNELQDKKNNLNSESMRLTILNSSLMSKEYSLTDKERRLNNQEKRLEEKENDLSIKEKKFNDMVDIHNTEKYTLLSDKSYNNAISFMNDKNYNSAINEFESCISSLNALISIKHSNRIELEKDKIKSINQFIVKCYISLKDYNKAFEISKKNNFDLTSIKNLLFENYRYDSTSLFLIMDAINYYNKYQITIPEYVIEDKNLKEWENIKSDCYDRANILLKNLESIQSLEINDNFIESIKNNYENLIEKFKKYSKYHSKTNIEIYESLLSYNKILNEKYTSFKDSENRIKKQKEDSNLEIELEQKLSLIKQKLISNEFSVIISLLDEIDKKIKNFHDESMKTSINNIFIEVKKNVNILYNKFLNNEIHINEIMSNFDKISTEKSVIDHIRKNFKIYYRLFFNKKIDENFINDLKFIIKQGTSEVSYFWYIFGYCYSIDNNLIDNINYKFNHYKSIDNETIETITETIEYAIPVILE